MKKFLFPLSIVSILTISSCSFFNVVPSDSKENSSFINSETSNTSNTSEGTSNSETSVSTTSTTSETTSDTSNTSITSDTSTTSDIASETSTTSDTSVTSDTTSETSNTSETTSTSEETSDYIYANIPTLKTTINHGSENDKYGDKTNSIDIPNTFLYWADTNWNGSVVEIGNHYAENKTIYYSYTIKSGSCDWGFQSFYKNSELTNGERYTISFILKSNKAGTIGVNGTNVSLISGTNNISVSYIEVSNEASFRLVCPTSIEDNTLEISDIKWVLKSDEGGDDTPTSEVTYPTGYTKLVFQDEFDGTSLDKSKWSYQFGNGDWGWGNGELQYYTDSNDIVKDGVLTIEAKNEKRGEQNYTSTRIRTYNKAHFTYGYIEARIALPEGTAMWPAFWLMPNDDYYGGWPKSGEIDIMEARGRLPYVTSSALHYTYQGSDDHTYSMSEYNHSSKITHYHTYACKWTSNSITFYVDGNVNYVAYKNSWQTYSDLTNDVAPFDKDFYIILNLAIGGQFDDWSTPDDETLPKQMIIDYVRWFQ